MKNKTEYLDDITLIKDLLLSVEEKSLIEYWTFYVWGILVIAGTFFHWYFSKMAHFNPEQLFYFIWLPLILICGLAETVSWVRKAGKDSRPLFTRPVIKYLSAWAAILIGGIFLILLLMEQGNFNYLPAAILAFSANIIIFYGMISYNILMKAGYAMISIAVFMFLFKVTGTPLLLISGISGGFISILAGVMIQRKESHGK